MDDEQEQAMRNATILGCVLGLAAVGCGDRVSDAAPIERETEVFDEGAYEPEEASGKPDEAAGLDYAQTSDEGVSEPESTPVEPPQYTPAEGEAAQLEDPMESRPMELAEPDEPYDGPLWGVRSDPAPQGAFIVGQGGQSYWVGRPPEEPEAEMTETEALVADAEARVAEAEARALEAEARLAEASTAAQEAAAAAREAREAAARPRVGGPGVIMGVPPGTFEEGTFTSDPSQVPTTEGAEDAPTAAGLGQRGVTAQPGVGQGGVRAEPGLGQQGLSPQPGAGQRGIGVQPGVGQGGVPASTGAGGGI